MDTDYYDLKQKLNYKLTELVSDVTNVLNEGVDDFELRKLRDSWKIRANTLDSDFRAFSGRYAENRWDAERNLIVAAIHNIGDAPNVALKTSLRNAQQTAVKAGGDLLGEFSMLCRLIEDREAVLEPSPPTADVSLETTPPSVYVTGEDWTQQSGFVIAASQRAREHLNAFSDEMRVLLRELDGVNDPDARQELAFIIPELTAITERLAAEVPGFNVQEIEDTKSLLDQAKEHPIAATIGLVLTFDGFLDLLNRILAAALGVG